MNTFENHRRILSVTAHPDDLEAHHSEALRLAETPYTLIASDGEASTLNYRLC